MTAAAGVCHLVMAQSAGVALQSPLSCPGMSDLIGMKETIRYLDLRLEAGRQQLGSTMELTPDGKGGLSGKYNSAVGTAEDFYILTGRFDISPPGGKGTSLGWVVNWRNSKLNANSTTTWSGQYFSGPETILTQWLLTASTDTSSVWESTNVGHDEFTRTKPSAEAIAKAKVLSYCSPHPEQIVAAKVHRAR